MRGGGVAPSILERTEAGAGLLHRLRGIQQVAGGPGQTVEPGHHKHVSGLEQLLFLEFGPVAARAAPLTELSLLAA